MTTKKIVGASKGRMMRKKVARCPAVRSGVGVGEGLDPFTSWGCNQAVTSIYKDVVRNRQLLVEGA